MGVLAPICEVVEWFFEKKFVTCCGQEEFCYKLLGRGFRRQRPARYT